MDLLRWLLGLAVVLVVPLVACSDAGITPVPSEASSERTTSEQRRLVYIDEITRCMAEQGFEYREPTTLPRDVAPADFVGMADADRLGYGMLLDNVRGRLNTARFLHDRGDEPRSDEYYAALAGDHGHDHDEGHDHDHDGGCRTKAAQAVLDALGPSDFEVFAELGPEVDERLIASSEYRKLDAEWATCMAESGLLKGADVQTHRANVLSESLQAVDDRVRRSVDAQGVSPDASISEVIEFIREDVDLSAAFDEEIRVAVADRACAPGLIELIRRFYSEAYETRGIVPPF